MISGAALLPHDLLYDVILSGAAPRSTAAALAHAQQILFQLYVYVIYLLRQPQTHFSGFFLNLFCRRRDAWTDPSSHMLLPGVAIPRKETRITIFCRIYDCAGNLSLGKLDVAKPETFCLFE